MVETTRRQAIEDVASDLFRVHGYAGTSIRDIARALSVQGASLYAHVEVLTADVDEAGVFVHEWRALGPERRATILERRDAYEARFRARVEEGIAVGAFALTDPAIAVSALLSALNGVAMWYDPAGRLPADRVADHLVELSLRMLEGRS